MGTQAALQSEGSSTCRVIKRYSNRKLYDTKGSRYVTLLNIADMVRAGEEVRIIDNATKEDKTEVTLALIISEELKERPRIIPLDTLKALIKSNGVATLPAVRGAEMLTQPQGNSPEDCREGYFASATFQPSRPHDHSAELANSDSDARQVVALQAQIRLLQQRLSQLESRLPAGSKRGI